MPTNLRIVKEENGNVSFIKIPSNLTDAVLLAASSIKVIDKSDLNNAEVIVYNTTGQRYGFLYTSVETVQIKPALPGPPPATPELLVKLLQESFFDSSTDAGGATEAKQDDIITALGLNAKEVKQDNIISALATLLTTNNFNSKVGEVSPNPTTNTVLARLKAIEDALSGGSNATEFSYKPEALDADFALPVSQKFILGNYVQDKDDLPSLLDRDGTGTQTYSNGIVDMSVGVGEYAVCQSFKRHLYLAGKTQTLEITFNQFGSQAGINKKVGLFNSSTSAPYNTQYDGIYLESTETTINLVVSKNGAAVTIPRASWLDPLDGTGASGLTLDFNNFTVCKIDFLYLGGTAVRLFFNVGGTPVLAHIYGNSGINASTFIGSPVQPVRWEVRSTTGTGNLGQICASVNTGGAIDVVGFPRVVDTGNNFINANTVGVNYLVAAIRLNTLNLSIFDIAAELLATTNDAYIQRLVLNPNIVGSLVWFPFGSTGLDFAIGDGGNPSDTIVVGGTALDTTLVSNNGREGQLRANSLFQPGASINGTADVLALSVQPVGSNLDIRGKLSFKTL